jgi:uncharacterized membrane protein
MVAVYGGVLRDPQKSMAEFNTILDQLQGDVLKELKIVPFPEKNIAVMTFVMEGARDEIDKLGATLGCMLNLTITPAAEIKGGETP